MCLPVGTSLLANLQVVVKTQFNYAKSAGKGLAVGTDLEILHVDSADRDHGHLCQSFGRFCGLKTMKIIQCSIHNRKECNDGE